MSFFAKKIYLKIFCVIGFFLAILLCIGIGYWCMVVVPRLDAARCGFNLAEMLRDMLDNYEDSFVFIDNTPYFRDKLVLTSTFDKKMLICPICQKTYVYSPVAPSGERIMLWRDEQRHKDNFVMWCPEPCHKGRRAFMYASSHVSMNSDSDVSWYYQKLSTDLTDDEFKKENEYRLSQGMKPLKKKEN